MSDEHANGRTMMAGDLLSAKEAAVRLGITTTGILKAVRSGALPAVRRAPTLLLVADVDAYPSRGQNGNRVRLIRDLCAAPDGLLADYVTMAPLTHESTPSVTAACAVLARARGEVARCK